MSSYRDDVNVTAVASDQLLTRLKDIAEGTAFVSDKVMERLRVLHESSAIISCEVFDRSVFVLEDAAAASDQVIDARTKRQLVTETARAGDALLHRSAAPLLESAAAVSDSTEHLTRALLTDSARASDQVIDARTKRQLVTETARAGDALWNRTKAPLLEAMAVAGDSTEHLTRALLTDSARASEEVIDARTKRQLVTEKARATDTLLHRNIAPVLENVATVSDSTAHCTRTLLVESARVSDEALQTRATRQLVVDAVRGADALVWRVRELVSESAAVDGMWLSKLHAAVVVDEVAAASDEVLDAYMARVPVLESTGRMGDALLDRLLARQLVIETAVVEDEVRQDGAAGQAWTAHEGGWAMSRWAPLDFTGLAVIDGVLYGTNARGVFALDGQTEELTAEIRTGLLDIGGDTTARLDGSYVEYRLDGTAQLDVTQTQQGLRETYTYGLPAKPSAELTSGRFVLGRGLRSRHYEFTLRLQGARGHINDWRLMTVPSTRRL